MPLVNFSNVDFDQIKQSITDYLRSNSNFTDYDFEGSNLSTIIDLLAYNTYITSYNANMVTNEVFIDSATLRENVVSLARNIGYLPRSRKAAKAIISFNVDLSDTNIVSATLKSGIVAITNAINARQSFTFSIPEDITVQVDENGLANFIDIEVYEGTHVVQNFNVSSNQPDQKFILPNAGIDTNLIRVKVKDNSSATEGNIFKQYNSLLEIEPTSEIYFIQEVDQERYELLFGDGIFGVKLQEPNQIEVGYIISSGQNGNNLSAFSFAGSLLDNNGAPIVSGFSQITTIQSSFGGASIESVDSIKKYSTQIYASQNRAVTSSDYEALIPQIYPEAESVSAFGGEDLSPPSFGKVFIAIKPENGVYISSSIKRNLQEELKKYSVAGIVSEIVDLKYLYIESHSNVYYNSNKTSSPSAIRSSVITNIDAYSDSVELNKFGARFKYSKYQNIIDNSNAAITSNITTINMRRDLEAVLDSFAEYEICFGNRFYIKNHGHNPVSNGTVIGYNIKSSGFRVSGITNTVYLGDKPNMGLKDGSLFLFSLRSPEEPIIVKQNVGTIDYIKGELKLNPIKIISTTVNRSTPLIEISAVPYSNDVIGLQDLYLQLDTSNVFVDAVIDQIASGTDTSGSNYIVSSSYSNGTIVRGMPQITDVNSNTNSNNSGQTSQVQFNNQTSNTSTIVSTGSAIQPSSQSTNSSQSYSY